MPEDLGDRSAGSGAEAELPSELLRRAAENPGGWVYELDDGFAVGGKVSPRRIVRAWRIDEHGAPTGRWVENPNHRPSADSRGPGGRRGRRLGLVALATMLLAAVAVVLAVGLTGSGSGRSHRHGQRTAARAPEPASATTTTDPPAGPGTHDGVGRTASAAPRPSVRAAGATRGARGGRPPSRAGRPPSRPLRVQIVPSGPVWVCLVSATGALLVNGRILEPGQPSPTFVGSRFRLFLGNHAAEVSVAGKLRTLPPSAGPLSYQIAPTGAVDRRAYAQPPCR